MLLWSFGGFFNSSDPNYIAGYRGVIVVECMRRVQLSLIESQNFDFQYNFAESQSELLGSVFWWTPNLVLVCDFLDVKSRFCLWSCNSSLIVDSIEISYSLNRSALGLPADFPTRVPTPPVGEPLTVWN